MRPLLRWSPYLVDAMEDSNRTVPQKSLSNSEVCHEIAAGEPNYHPYQTRQAGLERADTKMLSVSGAQPCVNRSPLSLTVSRRLR
mmetsp:Transcript_18457/g.38668  ORF Transcript_18457/g.38668 Transcript_18457/m.38668 type:complete len:85 (+) Transcript_18457:801-1055(+)